MSSHCVSKLYTAWNTAIRILFIVPRDTHRYLIESILKCLDFFLCKNVLNTVIGRNLFFIGNDCSVNLSDLSKILVKKQMKYFDVPLDHAWKIPVLHEQ